MDEEGGVNDETRALEEVLNAFLFFKTYGTEKIIAMVKNLKNLPKDHQMLIGGQYKEHLENLKVRMEHNHTVLRLIVNYSGQQFDESALRIHQPRRPSVDFQSKVMSTLRQICREWSSEGRNDREATFLPIIEHLDELFPDKTRRHDVRILVPGCGLGRLAHDLIEEGFTVEGNEFSFFMLVTSCFILNACTETNQYTIYPFLFEKSNSWSYEDQLRAVTFPDKNPSSLSNGGEVRKNAFSMCAGDFLEIVKNRQFDVICTAWFIDTAHNVIDYIEAIHSSLPPNGIWINVGPLTWHFEDIRDEKSIELPYSEVMRIVKSKGFHVVNEKRIESKYTANPTSMLRNQFTCAFFCAKKIENSLGN